MYVILWLWFVCHPQAPSSSELGSDSGSMCWTGSIVTNYAVVCRCVYQHPDSKGKIGVELSRDLVKVAAKALTRNLTKLGPKVLPWSEKLLFAANWVGRKVSPGTWKEYVPDFREAFDHFCLHAGETF